MKSAVVLGCTGLVGASVSKFLISRGIDVHCVGRHELSDEKILRVFGCKVRYLPCDLNSVRDLPELAARAGWQLGNECVFYNLAWSGVPKLTEGGLEIQLQNVSYAIDSLRAAVHMGCTKLIDAGSLEESRASVAIRENRPFNSLQFDYTIAKVAARDMCRLVAYLEHIDYVHTRLSVALSPDLRRGNFVSTSLKKILQGIPFDIPKSDSLVDITFTDDIANAFYLLGKCGKNKEDYYIGTGQPISLLDYFVTFERLVQTGIRPVAQQNLDTADIELFDIQRLKDDVGYVPTTDRYSLFLT